MKRRQNVQHGRARRHVSAFETSAIGALCGVFIAGMVLLTAPLWGWS